MSHHCLLDSSWMYLLILRYMSNNQTYYSHMMEYWYQQLEDTRLHLHLDIALVNHDYLPPMDFYSVKDDLYAIKKEVKDAQILEKQYQENNRSCFLFWCFDARDTYSGVNSKIQDLESNLKTIESKLSQIKSKQNTITEKIHKYEIDDKNLQIKNFN